MTTLITAAKETRIREIERNLELGDEYIHT